MTVEQYEQRTGLASSGHGALLPVREAMRIAGAEYRLMNLVLDRTKGISGYRSLHRLCTEAQRLALFAADGPGCSYPHCPIPAHCCQIDHTIAHGGPTRIENGVPACGFHNREAKHQGWQPTRINGRAAWIPPRWTDRDQEPRHNQLHTTDPPP